MSIIAFRAGRTSIIVCGASRTALTAADQISPWMAVDRARASLVAQQLGSARSADGRRGENVGPRLVHLEPRLHVAAHQVPQLRLRLGREYVEPEIGGADRIG